ncbi:CBM Family 50/Glycoside Hydrolase Family 23 protein [Glomus cerebriforme]|uniref:CBM Family 50/Glycoside Hydrolase Family 23 protein n=1 Tax=Glomus cerebriforme TaxID=658196 RepID=A0A397SWA1_9GLOM|nr:CBM Family 50/Glycoside Hydrolase Family 23 protein [Glomus cerebriforme]
MGKKYTVQPDDTFSNIAHKFGVSLQDLIAANPKIPNVDLIQPEEEINIPTGHTKTKLGPGATPQLEHFKEEIESGSEKTKVPANLIAAVIWQESRANPNASSNEGRDTGLMQINDNTFEDKHHIIGPNKNDPATNILGGSFYLSEMHAKFGDWPLALRAYNSGPESVDPHDPNHTGGIGDPNYVRNVLRFEKIIRTGDGVLDP